MITSPADRARDRAIYYAPTIAFDRPIPKVPAHVFLTERDRAFSREARTGLIDLDQRGALGLDWPASTPTLLARYLVVRAGDRFGTNQPSNGDVFYVVCGRGRSVCQGEELTWAEGDAFCLPGGVDATHQADADSVLLFVNDEPELRYLRAAPSGQDIIPPTLFEAARIDEHLREVHGRNGPQRASGKAVVFLTPPMAERRVTTPTILSSINTLEPGGDQRAHRHSSVALTMSIAGEDVHSMVDGERIDWSEFAVIVTPPNAVHSHHNRGAAMMRSFVAQDTGLHSQLRTTNFAWTEDT